MKLFRPADCPKFFFFSSSFFFFFFTPSNFVKIYLKNLIFCMNISLRNLQGVLRSNLMFLLKSSRVQPVCRSAVKHTTMLCSRCSQLLIGHNHGLQVGNVEGRQDIIHRPNAGVMIFIYLS